MWMQDRPIWYSLQRWVPSTWNTWLASRIRRVAIVNIGAEEEKGNALVKETFPLLKECKDINFIGSIEAREIPHGGADVIVCEAFVGNVILKLYEGVGATLISHGKDRA